MTDPFEYFNPVHDLANSVADFVILALQQQGVSCQKLIYPNEYPKALRAEDALIRRELDSSEVEVKTGGGGGLPTACPGIRPLEIGTAN